MNKQLNLKWVSETIGEGYKKWRKGDVVYIQAQTGTGKTFFITGDEKVKGLLDKMPCWEKLIYICNRIELKRQLKIDLLNKFGIRIKRDDKNKDMVDVDWLDNQTIINNVVITSYHAIADGELGNIYKDESNSVSDFDYIVCDECHFFLTDAGFNNKTYLAYEELVMKFHPRSIKIFISATMDEVGKSIEAVHELHKKGSLRGFNNYNLYKYSTGIDYNYLNVKYFKSLDDIIQIIKNDNTNEKWLVFVTSSVNGEKISQKLKELNITCTFINKDSVNDDKKNITTKSKFESKVVVSTKCLDNGINIKDVDVQNLVVMAYDKVTFIQECGRLRIKIDDARDVNLYIPLMDTRCFLGKLKSNYEPKNIDLELFRKSKDDFKHKYNNNLNKVPHDIFYLDKNNEWEINLLGSSRLHNDIKFSKNMLEKFKHDKFAFVKEQLKWLDLEDTFDKFNLIENVVDNEEVESLEKYLEDNIGRLYLKENKHELIGKISLSDSRGRLQKSPSLIKEYLEKNFNMTLRYDCETSRIIDGVKKKYKNCWKIYKIVC